MSPRAPQHPAPGSPGASVRDVLLLVQSGALPPPGAAATLGLTVVGVADGTASFGLVPAPPHLNAQGSVNGGVLAVLADFALCCALNDIPASDPVWTADLTLRFQRPVTVGSGPITAVATVLHRTERAATVEARIVDAHGRLHAHATGTVLTRPQPVPDPDDRLHDRTPHPADLAA